MKAYEFTIDNPLEYVLTGKFEALSPNWMHETMELIDYELFVISKGPLYLSYQNQDFTAGAASRQPPAGLQALGLQLLLDAFYILPSGDACNY